MANVVLLISLPFCPPPKKKFAGKLTPGGSVVYLGSFETCCSRHMFRLEAGLGRTSVFIGLGDGKYGKEDVKKMATCHISGFDSGTSRQNRKVPFMFTFCSAVRVWVEGLRPVGIWGHLQGENIQSGNLLSPVMRITWWMKLGGNLLLGHDALLAQLCDLIEYFAREMGDLLWHSCRPTRPSSPRANLHPTQSIQPNV